MTTVFLSPSSYRLLVMWLVQLSGTVTPSDLQHTDPCPKTHQLKYLSTYKVWKAANGGQIGTVPSYHSTLGFAY